ncbi:uncharacterized protein A1O5_01098 [Cladophialophora psammophila CBS 110553]|uniref:Transcription factor domain-containing protein n=1 Tax=Cladophialophora psammophila CBS 110553 TaxID=1182543 RepID=W9XGX3_9EURO|nr:uncharacterized protein A1O5_01098 [Cladophialophora psammophila CBS 110553]EXJ76590.1 hypothetical protein A1O5_01098 [Cladophialophora psammophila CBS 110553]
MFDHFEIETQESNIECAPVYGIQNDTLDADIYRQSFRNQSGETFAERHVPLDTPQPQILFDLSPTPAHSTPNPPNLMTQEESCADHEEQEVRRFFNDLYTIYPVVDKDIVSKRSHLGDPAPDAHFQTLLLALLMINSASDHRKIATQTTKAALQSRIEAVEQARSSYDFAECPTVDTVIVSFFLFCAYNTLWRQNRAFLYLREARDLFYIVSETVRDTSDTSSRRRLARLELIIFNAELATYAIYGPDIAYRQRPKSIPRGAAILQCDPPEDPREKQLDNILLQLSQIHASSANDTDNSSMGLTQSLLEMIDKNESPSISLERLTDQVRSFEASGSGGIRRLTADVIITHNWRSLEKISKMLDHRTNSPISGSAQGFQASAAIRRVISNKASSALAAACSLNEGDLRVVGLGKIAHITTSFREIHLRGGADLDECKNTLAGLLFTIVKTDYERTYAHTIQDCIELVLGYGPFSPLQNCLSPSRKIVSAFDGFKWDDMIEDDDHPEFPSRSYP